MACRSKGTEMQHGTEWGFKEALALFRHVDVWFLTVEYGTKIEAGNIIILFIYFLFFFVV